VGVGPAVMVLKRPRTPFSDTPERLDSTRRESRRRTRCTGVPRCYHQGSAYPEPSWHSGRARWRTRMTGKESLSMCARLSDRRRFLRSTLATTSAVLAFHRGLPTPDTVAKEAVGGPFHRRPYPPGTGLERRSAAQCRGPGQQSDRSAEATPFGSLTTPLPGPSRQMDQVAAVGTSDVLFAKCDLRMCISS
jgi:hypothetical protein